MGRILTGLLAVITWATGVVLFVQGDELLGAALVLAGGLLFVLAAGGGWSHFWEGVANWLHLR